MTRSHRTWMYRLLPLLAGGVVALMLLPGGQTTGNMAEVFVPSVAQQHIDAQLAAQAPKPAIVPAALNTGASGVLTPATPVAATASEAAVSSVVANVPAAAVSPQPGQAATLQQTAAASPDTAPAASLPSGAQAGQIGGTAVNARSGPSSGASKLFVLHAGEPVRIAEANAGWVHVYSASGQDGWVYSRYLSGQAAAAGASQSSEAVASTASPHPSHTQPAADNAATPGRYARVGGPVPVLSSPGAYDDAMFVLEPGERVRISGSRGHWLKVVTEDGETGWIPT